MGRWDDNNNNRPAGGRWGKKIGLGGGRIRTTRRLIIIGFIIVAAVIIATFLSRSGLYVEIIQREEGMGTLETITVRISNNNFYSLNDVTVQFDEDGKVQKIGNMGPFSATIITPPEDDMDFKNIIVKANDGQVQVVKSR